MASKKKIRWAFDPYADHPETWYRCVEVLNLLKDKGPVSIVPTYVLGSEHINWIGNMSPSSLEKARPVFQKAMNSRLKELDLIDFEEPEVLISRHATKRGDAQYIAKFLQDDGCDLLLMNTHARKGLERAFLGSFAENLLLHVQVPTLVVSPNTSPIEEMGHVLIPTDFSSKSKENFDRLLSNNFGLLEKLSLYSNVVYPSFAISGVVNDGYGGTWTSSEGFIENIKRERKVSADKWAGEASKRGVPTSIEINSVSSDVVDGILDFVSREKPDLLCMGTSAKALDFVVTGGITREVIRNSMIPVLVNHFRDGKE